VLRLPAETPASTGLACVTVAPALWRTVGYKPDLVLNAWSVILQGFAQAFPDKVYSMDILPGKDDFPPVDANGNPVSMDQMVDVGADLVTAAATQFPARLVVQSDFLLNGSTTTTGRVARLGPANGTMIAYQTNDYLAKNNRTSGAACGGTPEAPVSCTDASFFDQLELGVYPLGASNPPKATYIEVFAPNATSSPNAMQTARAQILN
jgi:hypothetical protein